RRPRLPAAHRGRRHRVHRLRGRARPHPPRRAAAERLHRAHPAPRPTSREGGRGRVVTADLDLVRARLLADLGADVVVVDPDRMSGYRYDRANDPAAGTPAAVVRAESTEDVQTAVRVAAELGVPVVTRGAGTGLSGGSTAQDGAITISTERLRDIRI